MELFLFIVLSMRPPGAGKARSEDDRNMKELSIFSTALPTVGSYIRITTYTVSI